ncbi:hypothetical protein [Nocardia wallacei]|uniref:hypothetical protein n=1 Tax=Nocardia wallacei TaxID=480035 RepID=UPI002455DDBE|nr:hypothetical protein [Nocardia wallacei]
MHRFVDLLPRQATPTHLHPITTQNLADRPPLDPEPIPQLIHRRTALVTGDHHPNLTIIKTTRSPLHAYRINPQFGTIGRWVVRID